MLLNTVNCGLFPYNMMRSIYSKVFMYYPVSSSHNLIKNRIIYSDWKNKRMVYYIVHHHSIILLTNDIRLTISVISSSCFKFCWSLDDLELSMKNEIKMSLFSVKLMQVSLVGVKILIRTKASVYQN